MSLEKRLRALEESTPKGYATFDADGRPAIQSDLPALQWFSWAQGLFRGRGRESEKKELRRQIVRSVGTDNGGGRIYELIAALIAGSKEDRGNNANHSPR